MALLEVRDLSVSYAPSGGRPVHAVRDVSFDIDEGEFVGLLGESGSGKSTLGTAILRLTERPGRISSGTVVFDGVDVTTKTDDELRGQRWVDLSTVFQSSMNSLNPVLTVEAQFRDVIEQHTGQSGAAVRKRIADLLEMVLIEPSYMRFYPHELSGGMKQRVCLALALALQPKFVLLDEPTTGLDVVVQRSILDSLRNLQREQGFAVMLISHDLGTVMEISDRVMVMYAGEIVETQAAAAAIRQPLHPYTRGLLGSYADPRAETINITYISGRPPDLSRAAPGCLFAPRCTEVVDRCHNEKPALLPLRGGATACHVAQERWSGKAIPVTEGGAVFSKRAPTRRALDSTETVLRVEGAHKRYVRRRGMQVHRVDAVRDVSFVLRKGTVTALVGQSGSGKSTIARMVTGIEKPDSGSVWFGERRVDTLRRRGLRDFRRHAQLVFQDPFAALNPTSTVRYALSRPLRNYHGLSARDADARVEELLDTVGLSPASAFVDKFPHQLSGGERQRVVVARALAPDPEIIVADEPISMLDVSIRAEILELLDNLVRERHIAMLYITHDLLSARLLADEILVLNQGRVVESGPALEVIRNSQDDYTKLLLRSLPNPFAAEPTVSDNLTADI